MADRQRATAMYFIDRLALRAGNEKGEDEADTVGCCSLRCEHVTLEQPNFLIFDFLGKDSIRYYNRVAVETQVFKNIRIFKENKTDDDNLFDRVTVRQSLESAYAKVKLNLVFVDESHEQTFSIVHERIDS
jgi:DNA topoisomerase I